MQSLGNDWGNSTATMRILVADQEPEMLEAIARAFEVDVATSKATCIDLLRANSFDVLVACERLSDGSGLELLSHVGQRWPHVIRILAIEPERRAMLRGRLGPFKLFETIAYPIDADKMEAALTRAAEAIAENEANAPTAQPAPRNQAVRNQVAREQIAKGPAVAATSPSPSKPPQLTPPAATTPATRSGPPGAPGAQGAPPSGPARSGANQSAWSPAGSPRGAPPGAPGSGGSRLGSASDRPGGPGWADHAGANQHGVTHGGVSRGGANPGGANSGGPSQGGLGRGGASQGAASRSAPASNVTKGPPKDDARHPGSRTADTSSALRGRNVPLPSGSSPQRSSQGLTGNPGADAYPPLPSKGSKIVPLGSPGTHEFKILPHDYQHQSMPGTPRAQRGPQKKEASLQEKAVSLADDAKAALSAAFRYLKPQSASDNDDDDDDNPLKTPPRNKR